MHGRLKVRTTEEQQEAKRKEREKKLKIYNAANNRILEKRKNKEYDDEALELTGQILSANPDYYSLWNYRKEIFTEFKNTKSADELQKSFDEELFFLESCLRINPKSYGSWQHRCFVMDNAPKPNWKRELELCNKYLEYDERNFHCWDYRRFVVQRSKVQPEKELQYTMDKISANFSNFSSWHYRSKLLPIIHPDPKNHVGVQEDTLLQEFELVQNAFFTDPNDQSAWFYHRWLLGRGERPLAVDVIHVSRSPPRISVLLTKAEKIDKEKCPLVLTIGGQVFDAKWKSPSGEQYSSLWISDLDKDHLPETEDVTICTSISSQNLNTVLKQNDTESWNRIKQKSGSMFSYELSAATSSVLQQELESCQQLHELEPENKWTLLTIVSLMRATDPLKHEADTLEYLKKMIEVDPTRTNYYKDLRSKILIENQIESSDKNCRTLDLSKKDLTTLYHHEHMMLLNSIDLSQNALSNVKCFHFMQCIKTINLDNNKITDCHGIEGLPMLEEISLKNNCLTTLESLHSLSACPKLSVVYLQGNPILEIEDLKSKLPPYCRS